jgi:EAL domain-containing protein (putative c-di-GMP-specific phosphodiesterase class I)/GGDEF domain-containing protein
VRIDIRKDLPLTVGQEYRVGKKPITVNLIDIVNVEDLTHLLARIDELTMSGTGSLRVSCRFVPGNKRYIICCDIRRKKERKRFGKTVDYLYGVIMDVEEFNKNRTSDPVEQAYIKKELAKFSAGGDLGIVEIIGMEQLSSIQVPLTANRGLHSAIFTDNGKFICTADPSQKSFNIGDYRHSRNLYIKINHKIYASWLIFSDDIALIERYSPVHDVLAQSLSKISNFYVMLFNEMVNTEHANKLLSETIEQQMLLNGIYAKLLNERNTVTTMQMIVNLTGEYLKLERIIVCEDVPAEKKYKSVYEWVATRTVNEDEECEREVTKLNEFKYSDYPTLIDELASYETYFSNNPEHDVLGLDFSSYVASNLNGDGERYGLIIYVINDVSRVLSHAEKRLLRSVSQIIAAVILRCKDNDKLDETNERLHHLAYRDAVLGVKNKASLMDDISLSLNRGQSGAVVAFKIPGMKNIENFVGLGCTDVLYAKILEDISNYEKLSAEPYRYSDKLFVALLRKCNTLSARDFCEDLIKRFTKPWQLDGIEHHLDVTAGVALYPEAGTTAEELCRIAIMSMNKAAEYKTNSYAFFSGDFEHPEIDGYQCAQILRTAVENNMEGLSVEYLPVYSAAVTGSVDDTGGKPLRKIVSCEALLTVSSTAGVLYPPHIIMRIAEKMGIDVTVNSWLIEKACEFCKKARVNNPTLTVSVHATARSLTADTIVTMISNALTKTGLPPNGLAVQFSERVVAVNYDKFIIILSELQKAGVSVILDNIGSYYTATSLLRYTGITAVKADMTIFSGVVDDFSRVYLANIKQLARDNKVSIGVKGLESPEGIEDKELIEAMSGINWYQGDLYSRTMSDKELLGMGL